jgi:hypothetical protein
MTYQEFPYPTSLKRLRIHDDLIINAERWQFAHSYHRHRQNLIFRSLNQPGIVTGLGVKAIEKPENIPERAKNKCWLEIQPGIAIDINGNPVIVDSSIELMKRCYPIAVTSAQTKILTIYIVIQYRDPDSLDQDNLELKLNPEKISEGFRLYHSTQPAKVENGEVELCRIQIQPGFTKLENPQDPLSPKINQIDLTYRIPAQSKPLATIRIASTAPLHQNLQSLVDSLPALFPTLEASLEKEPVYIEDTNLANYDLLCLSSEHIFNLNNHQINNLKQYLDRGGTILIEANALTTDLEQQIQKYLLVSESFDQLNLQLNNFLLKKPFLFQKLPEVYNQPINISISNQGRIIIITQPFSSACCGNNLARQDIRTIHELGINILHFAWQRRHFTQLLH